MSQKAITADASYLVHMQVPFDKNYLYNAEYHAERRTQKPLTMEKQNFYDTALL